MRFDEFEYGDSRPMRNVFNNHFSMETSIFDEDFVGVHSGDHDTRQIDPGHIAFKGVLVGWSLIGGVEVCGMVADRRG
jgi:hypothetical protein